MSSLTSASVRRDTNAYYITPISLKILGENKIKQKFLEFKKEIEKITSRKYKIKPKVYLFNDLISPYRRKYDYSFNQALNILNKNTPRLLSAKIWQEQLRYTQKHIGFKKSQQEEIAEFSKRAIATYGAEGIIFNLLSGTKNFSNCVWLNIEEVGDRVIAITNCLRIKRRLGNLPMLFLR